MARQLRPGLKTLFITGYAEGAASRSRFLEPGMDLIAKPFTLDALAAKIRRMIESAPPAKAGCRNKARSSPKIWRATRSRCLDLAAPRT